MIAAQQEERRARHRESARLSYHRNKHKPEFKARAAAWRERNYAKVLADARQRNRAQPWRYLLARAKRASKLRGLKFDLTPEWALARFTGRCEVTGLLFKVDGKQGPFSPSIDRIVPEKGYTRRNCRFVVLGYNMLKHSGSDADARKIARALAK